MVATGLPPSQIREGYWAAFKTRVPSYRIAGPPSIIEVPRSAILVLAVLVAIVVDGKAVFISSANFTEAAQERNIEMGLLVRSRWLAERVTRHFETLLLAGLLERAL
jgi:hypothetical protein